MIWAVITLLNNARQFTFVKNPLSLFLSRPPYIPEGPETKKPIILLLGFASTRTNPHTLTHSTIIR